MVPTLTVLVMLTSDYTHLFRYDFGLAMSVTSASSPSATAPGTGLRGLQHYFLPSPPSRPPSGRPRAPERSIRSRRRPDPGDPDPHRHRSPFNLGITPIQGYSFASSSMIVTGVLFFWALFSYRIMDLRPVARSEVVESCPTSTWSSMRRTVWSTTTRPRRSSSASSGTRSVGSELSAIMPAGPAFYDKLGGQSDFVEELEGIVESDGRLDEATVTGSLPGRTGRQKRILLRDITERKKAENELRLSEEKISGNCWTPPRFPSPSPERMTEDCFSSTGGRSTISRSVRRRPSRPASRTTTDRSGAQEKRPSVHRRERLTWTISSS